MKIKLTESQLKSIVRQSVQEVYYRKKIKTIKENMQIFYENNTEVVEKEAEKVQDTAQGQGLPVSKKDAVAIVTAIAGGAATAASSTGVGMTIGWTINAILLSKALYDYTQSLSAAEKANKLLEEVLGRPVLQGAIDSALSNIPMIGDYFNKSLKEMMPMTPEEMEIISNLPPAQFSKLSQYLVSAIQYKRRMWVDMLGAIPTGGPYAVFDVPIKSLGAAIAIAPIDKLVISMAKATKLLADNFPGFMALAEKDNWVGEAVRFMLSDLFNYTLGSIYEALNLLEPGAGDQLTQYVDMTDVGRQGTQKDVVDYYVKDAQQNKLDQQRLEKAGIADVQLAEIFRKIDILEAKQKKTKRDPRKDFIYPYAYGIGRRRDYEEDEDDIQLDDYVFGDIGDFGGGGDGGGE